MFPFANAFKDTLHNSNCKSLPKNHTEMLCQSNSSNVFGKLTLNILLAFSGITAFEYFKAQVQARDQSLDPLVRFISSVVSCLLFYNLQDLDPRKFQITIHYLKYKALLSGKMHCKWKKLESSRCDLWNVMFLYIRNPDVSLTCILKFSYLLLFQITGEVSEQPLKMTQQFCRVNYDSGHTELTFL